uniref:Uncharacterized protein n=1 Tax=Tetraselmis chuii TaxID=63592 RepID=A0A6U1HCC2_9CHLO|mmetsp:Transcript_27341/g.48708  ORF Transcript_27341/g.48708 Transcript_27341/m.48708 type:complete len:409 (+) Transcript_27341:134-1360(+)
MCQAAEMYMYWHRHGPPFRCPDVLTLLTGWAAAARGGDCTLNSQTWLESYPGYPLSCPTLSPTGTPGTMSKRPANTEPSVPSRRLRSSSSFVAEHLQGAAHTNASPATLDHTSAWMIGTPAEKATSEHHIDGSQLPAAVAVFGYFAPSAEQSAAVEAVHSTTVIDDHTMPLSPQPQPPPVEVSPPPSVPRRSPHLSTLGSPAHGQHAAATAQDASQSSALSQLPQPLISRSPTPAKLEVLAKFCAGLRESGRESYRILDQDAMQLLRHWAGQELHVQYLCDIRRHPVQQLKLEAVHALMQQRHTEMLPFHHTANAQNVGYASDGQVYNAAAEAAVGDHVPFEGSYHLAWQNDDHSALDVMTMSAPGDPMPEESGSVGLCVPTANPDTFIVNGEVVNIKKEGGEEWFIC